MKLIQALLALFCCAGMTLAIELSDPAIHEVRADGDENGDGEAAAGTAD